MPLTRPRLEFRPPALRAPAWGDVVVVGLVAAVLFGAILLARSTPAALRGPRIVLAPGVLPLYAALSLGRMAAAYVLSLGFTLAYGRIAAGRPAAERVLMPMLDVLQSVPILSFLPLVLLSLAAVLPRAVAVELASIVLLFTSQAWNLTFSWYQSLRSVPEQLREATATFRFGGWLRFRLLELPHAANGLVWNSMMSWAGGWFFLMAAESFTVGARDFRLPGLGSYLQAAADAANMHAVAIGIVTLVVLIVALDQLVWRPLLAWSQRFRLEAVAGETAGGSWFLAVLRSSRITTWLGRRLAAVVELLDRLLARRGRRPTGRRAAARVLGLVLPLLVGAAAAYGCGRAVAVLVRVPAGGWVAIGAGLGATFLRVATALAIAAAWTIPVGVAIGTSRRLARFLQPLTQIAASVPATAVFPVLLLGLLGLPFGVNIAAVVLMLMGTQWYLLFNVIAGASAVPVDLRQATRLFGLSKPQRWRALLLPAIFPSAVTGAITAAGGAWNASIVAEYIHFGGATHSTVGIGAVIAAASARGDFSLLLAATVAMIATVILVNRTVWRRLYRLAEERYRME